MRIALIVPGGVDRTGEYRVIPALLALIGRLARHHDVSVIALHQEIEPGEWILAGAAIYNIGARATRRRAWRKLRALHRTTPFELIHAIWSGTCGLLAVVAGRLLRIPTVIHIAGGELVSMPDIRFGGLQSRRGRLREAVVLRAASVVTAASAPTIRVLAERGIVAQRVPLGVDLDRWPPRAPVPRRAGAPAKLIHVASLNRVKDQTTLLKALAQLLESGVEFAMDIIGEDTLDGEIEALAAHLGLQKRIRFHGFLTQRQLRPLLESADVMLITSLHETGPLVVLEAAVAGIPTVGTAVGHIAEWAPDAALAVPVGDWLELAAAVRRIIGDELLRMRVARDAHERATHHDANFTARRFDAIYASVGR